MKYLILLILLIIPSLSFASVNIVGLTTVEQQAFTSGLYHSLATDGTNTVVGMRFLAPATATTNLPSPLTRIATRSGALALGRSGLAFVGSKLPLVGVAVTGYMLYNDLKGIVSDDPSAYPNLLNSLYRPDLPQVPSVGSYVTAANGDIYQVATMFTTSGFSSDMSMQSDATATGWQVVIYGPYAYNGNYGYSGYTWVRYYGATTGLIIHPSNVPQTPLSDAEIAANFDSVNGLTPAQRAELDQIMRNNPQHVVVDNTSDIATALLTANADQAREAKTREITALQDLVDSLNNEYATNPTEETFRKLKEAIASLEKAKSDISLLSQQETDRESDQLTDPGTNTYDPNIETPEKKDIPGRITTFMNGSAISSFFDKFGLTTSTPNSQIYLGHEYDQDYIIDFADYEGIWVTIGTILLAFSTLSAIYIVLRKGY